VRRTPNPNLLRVEALTGAVQCAEGRDGVLALGSKANALSVAEMNAEAVRLPAHRL
jgi:hypothetical protein